MTLMSTIVPSMAVTAMPISVARILASARGDRGTTIPAVPQAGIERRRRRGGGGTGAPAGPGATQGIGDRVVGPCAVGEAGVIGRRPEIDKACRAGSQLRRQDPPMRHLRYLQ